MPRRTPTLELQEAETGISSPIRRSSRIAQNQKTPATLTTRRASADPTDVPSAGNRKSRRFSLSQEVGGDNIDSGRSTPVLMVDKEVKTPRKRRGSVDEEIESRTPMQTRAATPTISKTRSRSTHSRSASPQKMEETISENTTKTRLKHVTEKLKPLAVIEEVDTNLQTEVESAVNKDESNSVEKSYDSASKCVKEAVVVLHASDIVSEVNKEKLQLDTEQKVADSNENTSPNNLDDLHKKSNLAKGLKEAVIILENSSYVENYNATSEPEEDHTTDLSASNEITKSEEIANSRNTSLKEDISDIKVLECNSNDNVINSNTISEQSTANNEAKSIESEECNSLESSNKENNEIKNISISSMEEAEDFIESSQEKTMLLNASSHETSKEPEYNQNGNKNITNAPKILNVVTLKRASLSNDSDINTNEALNISEKHDDEKSRSNLNSSPTKEVNQEKPSKSSEIALKDMLANTETEMKSSNKILQNNKDLNEENIASDSFCEPMEVEEYPSYLLNNSNSQPSAEISEEGEKSCPTNNVRVDETDVINASDDIKSKVEQEDCQNHSHEQSTKSALDVTISKVVVEDISEEETEILRTNEETEKIQHAEGTKERVESTDKEVDIQETEEDKEVMQLNKQNQEKENTTYDSKGNDINDDVTINEHSDKEEESNEDQAQEKSKMQKVSEDEKIQNNFEKTEPKNDNFKKETPEKNLTKCKKVESKLDEKVTQLIDKKYRYLNVVDSDTEIDIESVTDYLDISAEEGQEDTPSEDSNQIVDEGESVGFSSSDEQETDDTYGEDSFIDKDEQSFELLSGEEYDLELNKENNDKKSNKGKMKQTEKKKSHSRIITIKSSGESNESEEENSKLNSSNKTTKKSPKKKQSEVNTVDNEPQKKRRFSENVGNEMEQSATTCDEATQTMTSESKMITDTNESLKMVEAETSINVEETNDAEVQSKRKRKHSLSIMESVSLEDICGRVDQIVGLFSSVIQSSNKRVSLNMSLSYDSDSDSEKNKEFSEKEEPLSISLQNLKDSEESKNTQKVLSKSFSESIECTDNAKTDFSFSKSEKLTQKVPSLPLVESKKKKRRHTKNFNDDFDTRKCDEICSPSKTKTCSDSVMDLNIENVESRSSEKKSKKQKYTADIEVQKRETMEENELDIRMTSLSKPKRRKSTKAGFQDSFKNETIDSTLEKSKKDSSLQKSTKKKSTENKLDVLEETSTLYAEVQNAEVNVLEAQKILQRHKSHKDKKGSMVKHKNTASDTPELSFDQVQEKHKSETIEKHTLVDANDISDGNKRSKSKKNINEKDSVPHKREKRFKSKKNINENNTVPNELELTKVVSDLPDSTRKSLGVKETAEIQDTGTNLAALLNRKEIQIENICDLKSSKKVKEKNKSETVPGTIKKHALIDTVDIPDSDMRSEKETIINEEDSVSCKREKKSKTKKNINKENTVPNELELTKVACSSSDSKKKASGVQDIEADLDLLNRKGIQTGNTCDLLKPSKKSTNPVKTETYNLDSSEIQLIPLKHSVTSSDEILPKKHKKQQLTDSHSDKALKLNRKRKHQELYEGREHTKNTQTIENSNQKQLESSEEKFAVSVTNNPKFWIVQELDSPMKPSKRRKSRQKKKTPKPQTMSNVKDFKNKMLYDPRRTERIETEDLFKKKAKAKYLTYYYDPHRMDL